MFISDPYGAIEQEKYCDQNNQTLHNAGFSDKDRKIVLSNTFLRFMNTDVLSSMAVGHPSLIWHHLKIEAQKAPSPMDPKFTEFAAKIIAYAYLPNFSLNNNPFEPNDSSKIDMFVALAKIKRGALCLSKVDGVLNTYTYST